MNKKGFTLIEMMIALAIFSIFVAFLYNAYFSQIKENNYFINRLDLKYNGDKAMNLITDELRSNIIIPNTDIITKPSTTDITQIKSNNNNLIDLTGSVSSELMFMSSQKSLLEGSDSLALCKGITSIGMQHNGDLIIITIDLQSKNDQYTVTSAVNINK